MIVTSVLIKPTKVYSAHTALSRSLRPRRQNSVQVRRRRPLEQGNTLRSRQG